MSNISSHHNVVSFNAAESKAFAGQRLIKVCYKSRGDKKAELPNVCVSVPPVSLKDEELILLKEYVEQMVMDTQDKIVKGMYESRTRDGLKLDRISDEDISLNSVIGYLSAVSTGGRLTKDGIVNWFDNSGVADVITVLLVDKLGFPDVLNGEQNGVIEKHLDSYKSVFMSLSAPSVSLEEKQVNGLVKIMDMFSPSGDCVDNVKDVNNKIVNKLGVLVASLREKKELIDLL